MGGGGVLEWGGVEVEKRLFKVVCGGGVRRGGRFLELVLVFFMIWKVVFKYGVSVYFFFFWLVY